MELVMDIFLYIFLQNCIGNKHCLYNFYFTHNVALTELVFSCIRGEFVRFYSMSDAQG